MADGTGIEWCDATWNPVTGCTEVTPGCDHCYAKTFAERWRGTPGHYFEQGFDVVLRPDKLDLPLRWTKPRRVFVNSMSDLFHDDVPEEFIAHVFAVMSLARQHTFQILTKRHGRMRSLLNSDRFNDDVHLAAAVIMGERGDNTVRSWHWPLRNVWLGVSVEDQKRADLRIPALLDTPAAVRFLSCEPLLGHVDTTDYLRRWETCETCGGSGSVPVPGGGAQCTQCVGGELPTGPRAIDWVIVGGESGPGARPMEARWARSLRGQCEAAGVPFFMKQAGVALAREWGVPGKGDNPDLWPEPFPQEFPNAS